MYIKINLLPKSYYERKAAARLIPLFVLILALVVGGLFGYKVKVLDTEIAELNKKIEVAKDIQAKVNALNNEVEQKRSEVAFYTKRVDFMDAVMRFNQSIPSVFEKVAMWTYDKVQYTSLGTDGRSVTIQGRARSLDDIGRYILNLYKAGDVFTNISLSVAGLGSGSGTGTGMSMPGMPSTPSMPSMPSTPSMSGGSMVFTA